MGEHKFNPQAAAKAQGGQMVRLSDLGDGVAFAGFELRPVGVAPGPCDCSDSLHISERPECPANMPPTMAAGLFAIGGKHSTLSLNVELRAVFLGEIGRIPVGELKRLLTQDAAADRAEEQRLTREAHRFCSACGLLGGGHKDICPRAGLPADRDAEEPAA